MKKIGLLLCTTILLSACANNEAGQRKNSNNITPRTISVKDSNIKSVDRKTGQQISQRLVDLAVSVPNVKDATAVVFSNYALVGIDVDDNIDRSRVGSIKYSVAESLKHDPYGANAIIVADPDFTQRLREIGQDIRDGKPGQGIIHELADIAGRLMPEIPKNIIEPKNPQGGTETPKQELNQSEDNKLEKEQENQSNNKK
ncbi:YhcN/YlaJ family sporulation lipoprotein [Heyndrickxia vini]|uniref:YhcN/YlaJ family sporulation lipoprotein n=1 Tax=Heyndrickxia vini TaxID=1476025 RepID=A0ABX7DYE4_9BACI|nr:YhcN/YlaJ family sporulation lipoprotein [Heyndrickxia vini]QQZ08080.1 YhcN/YlaJ family sporulation lipoprotein [Heyndrickxia vini]